MPFSERAILEAILFASGDPIPFSRLADASGIAEKQLPTVLNDLNQHYADNGHALQVLLLEQTAQLCTREPYAPYIQAALEQKRTLPLTPAALEVLTIAAYHQPVTKRFISHVRGIDSGSLVNTLVERELLEEAERMDLPGRPIAYRTTNTFLRCFGLSSLKDLPPLPEIPVPETIDPSDHPA
ncbi:MAG: SMC-Scp complex subunit ScpB [Oscillospiraceae bacterium]|nr:SMC-Scp complex subunit ScpB [Oscillospiraceae bacterium]